MIANNNNKSPISAPRLIFTLTLPFSLFQIAPEEKCIYKQSGQKKRSAVAASPILGIGVKGNRKTIKGKYVPAGVRKNP